jgi:signal peptidase II
MPKKSSSQWLLAGAVILVVLLLDQSLKYWVKTSMLLREDIVIFPNWFILHFTENNGMAFGIELGGDIGKYLLTFFRIAAVGGILYFLNLQIKAGISRFSVICISLIMAGAMGNIIDSVFYGALFTSSGDLYGYPSVEQVHAVVDPANAYSTYFKGKVVDMLYFPLVETTWPEWVPILGGDSFTFFRPVFNIADAAISVGVFLILLFQRGILRK